jgi:hypothetical protein
MQLGHKYLAAQRNGKRAARWRTRSAGELVWPQPLVRLTAEGETGRQRRSVVAPGLVYSHCRLPSWLMICILLHSLNLMELAVVCGLQTQDMDASSLQAIEQALQDIE